MALEAIKGEKSVLEIARAYGIHPNTVIKYRNELMQKGRTSSLGKPRRVREGSPRLWSTTTRGEAS